MATQLATNGYEVAKSLMVKDLSGYVNVIGHCNRNRLTSRLSLAGARQSLFVRSFAQDFVAREVVVEFHCFQETITARTVP